jgi:streptomycin 6-kinase
VTVRIPPDLLAIEPQRRRAWLDRLPALVRDLLGEWRLAVDGEPTHGVCALVAPVRTEDDVPAVLKVGWPHDEAEHEHLALQHWHGDGAALLLRADPGRSAMLLERLHQRDLSELWDVEACEVVAGLYARLHVPAPPQLRPLAEYVDRGTVRLAVPPRDAGLPHGVVEPAVALGRGFAADDAPGRMLHTDLHYENVLAADREPWLVIDPKPVSGDPHYEVAALLWNRWDELSGDVRGGVRRRFEATVDAAGFDEDRARDWVVVRMLHNALWELEDAARERREPDRDWLTRCVTLAKAVQE